MPATAGLLKRTTGVHCPWDVARYGGEVPYRHLFDRRPAGECCSERARCFPAAHASGGFALMAFALVGARRTRHALLGAAFGWVLGAYQMARGAHFLSHTLVSMLLAWLVVLLLARAFGLDRSAEPEAAPPGHAAPG